MQCTNILLVDDHALFRSCLRNVIEQQQGMEVIGEAGDGREAVELARKLRPRVIVMDIAMPKLNGIEATRQIVDGNGHSKILALSMYRRDNYIHDMLKAGASGYILKTYPVEQLFQAIQTGANGQTYLPPETGDILVSDYRSGSSNNGSVELTKRQREILQLVAEGHSTKSIASNLKVSSKTVESHRQQLMQKLDIHSIAELTRYALQEGLTTFEVM